MMIPEILYYNIDRRHVYYLHLPNISIGILVGSPNGKSITSPRVWLDNKNSVPVEFCEFDGSPFQKWLLIYLPKHRLIHSLLKFGAYFSTF